MGSRQASRVPVGLDFFGLREYEVGDDLRRVHWRSTARTGELMLRQDEMPWEARSTILLDTRPSTHHGESFERAVEIAASLATAMCRGRRLVRFMTTGGVEIRSSGSDRYAQIMEYLAGASLETYVRWDQVMEGLRRTRRRARWPPSWPTSSGPTSPPWGRCGPGSGWSSSAPSAPRPTARSTSEPAPAAPGRHGRPRLGRQPLPHGLEQGGDDMSAQRSGSLLTLATLSVVGTLGFARLFGDASWVLPVLLAAVGRPRRRAGDPPLAGAAGHRSSRRWPWACCSAPWWPGTPPSTACRPPARWRRWAGPGRPGSTPSATPSPPPR